MNDVNIFPYKGFLNSEQLARYLKTNYKYAPIIPKIQNELYNYMIENYMLQTVAGWAEDFIDETIGKRGGLYGAIVAIADDAIVANCKIPASLKRVEYLISLTEMIEILFTTDSLSTIEGPILNNICKRLVNEIKTAKLPSTKCTCRHCLHLIADAY